MPEDVQSIAKEAYVYGYPMVMGYKLLYNNSVDEDSPDYKGPLNRLSCEARLYTPNDRAIVTPNADTPYCMFWMDLRAEPLVLTVPEIDPERYFSVQLVDLYAHNFAYVGTLTTGNAGGSYLIAGPDWVGEKPDDIREVFRSETPFIYNVTRTQLFGPDDLPQVKEIQEAIELQPLSSHVGVPAPPAAALPQLPEWVEGAQFDERALVYLNTMMTLVKKPVPEEKPLWDRMARLGLGPDRTFDPAALAPGEREAVLAGVQEGFGEIEKILAEIAKDSLASAKIFGTREFLIRSAKENYGHEDPYLIKAAGAHSGLYGNSGSEAIYPTYFTDSDQQPLDASVNSYTLTLREGELPPVKAFWSLSLYDGETKLFVENSLDRYVLNSAMMEQFKPTEDGSMVLYISSASPGPDLESNWLPAPAGPFNLVMRLYGPEPEVLEGKWTPPQVERANPPDVKKEGK